MCMKLNVWHKSNRHVRNERILLQLLAFDSCALERSKRLLLWTRKKSDAASEKMLTKKKRSKLIFELIYFIMNFIANVIGSHRTGFGRELKSCDFSKHFIRVLRLL